MAAEYRTPAQTTPPVAATTAGLWTFATPAGCLLLANWTTKTINVRLNSASAATAAGGGFDFLMATDEQRVITLKDYGLAKISTVSVWMPTGSTVANFNIRGI